MGLAYGCRCKTNVVGESEIKAVEIYCADAVDSTASQCRKNPFREKILVASKRSWAEVIFSQGQPLDAELFKGC
jgi:hypothetical protein